MLCRSGCLLFIEGGKEQCPLPPTPTPLYSRLPGSCKGDNRGCWRGRRTNFRMGIRSLVEEVFLYHSCGQVPLHWDGCAREPSKVTVQMEE